MLRETYLHPNGQMPAYEWNFSDVNPPVHAWATLFLYQHGAATLGRADVEFLKRSFHKLLLNFTWWVNRKDPHGRNVFEGGFLGLDNIGVFDRSAPLPTGGYLEQADGTAWMAFFCQYMLEIALEPRDRRSDLRRRWRSSSLSTSSGSRPRWTASASTGGMWDEEDGFFYDVLRLPDGQATAAQSAVDGRPAAALRDNRDRGEQRERFRRLVGLMQLASASVIPSSSAHIAPTGEGRGLCGRRLLSLAQRGQARRVLGHLLDENEFLSPYGIRSLSRYHLDIRYVFDVGGQELSGRLPAGGIGQRACSAATRTGAGRSGCRSTG